MQPRVIKCFGFSFRFTNFFRTELTTDFLYDARIPPASKNEGTFAVNQGARLSLTKETAKPSALARDKIDRHNCSPSRDYMKLGTGGFVLWRELERSIT